MKRYFHVLLISYLLFYKENRNHFSDVTGIELWKHLENFGELEIAIFLKEVTDSVYRDRIIH